MNVLQADSLIQKIMGKTVPKIVRVHSLFDSSSLSKSLEKVPHIDRLDRLPEIHFRDAAKNGGIANTVDPDRFSFFYPLIEVHLCLCVQSNHAHLVSFSNNADRSLVWIVIAGANPQSLGDAKSTPIENNQ